MLNQKGKTLEKDLGKKTLKNDVKDVEIIHMVLKIL